ncbi:MAG: outer membrane beta-barrel protein [Crocinitomicaceae bacterium]
MKLMLALLVLLISTSSFSQLITVKGSIPQEILNDQIGQITIFSAVDSSLKKGSYIDTSEFELAFNGKLNQDYYAKVKLQGYVDTLVNFTTTSKEVNLGIVQLSPDLNLNTVEVVYREPAFERTMDGIKVNVSGTTLEQLTNLFEILKASPRLTSPDDERIEIIGKGSPLILIDRQPILSNDELKAIPAEMVEKIEIITNPSAKYKAQGRGSGVIEVYTKNFTLQGYNVTLSGAGGINTQLKPTANGNIGLSLKKKKFSLNANLGTNYREQYSYGSGNFLTTDGTERNEVSGFNAESSNFSPHVNVKGAYSIKDNHKITMGLRGHANHYSGDHIDSALFYQYDELMVRSNKESHQGYTWVNASSFMNYVWETDTFNSAFEINVNYRIKVDEGSVTARNVYFDENTNQFSDFNVQNQSRNRPNVAEFRTNYEHNFDTTGWKLGGGVSYNLVFNGKEFDQFNEVGNDWVIDPNLSNSYDYVEQNGSSYIELSKKWKKLGFRAGLSGEYTDLNGYSNSLNQQFIDSAYFLLFPSASIMIDPNEKVGLTFTYSSGIDRPRFSNYDPFVVVEDSLNVHFGNPYLLPEVTQSFGFELNLLYKYNLSVNYYHSEDPQAQLSFINPETFVYSNTPWNADKKQGFSVSINAPIKTKWMSAWNSIWLNYDKYSFTPIFEREDFFTLTYGLWSYANFFLPKDFTITNRVYFGRWGSDDRIANARVNWGMRLTKKMMGNKFQIYLDVQDILPPSNRMEVYSTNYQGLSENRWAFTAFKLGLYYKFGRLTQDANIKESKSGQSGRI